VGKFYKYPYKVQNKVLEFIVHVMYIVLVNTFLTNIQRLTQDYDFNCNEFFSLKQNIQLHSGVTWMNFAPNLRTFFKLSHQNTWLERFWKQLWRAGNMWRLKTELV